MLIHPILFPATYAGFALAEQLFPAVPLLRVKRWRVKGLIFFALGGVYNSLLPALWHDHIGSLRLMNLSALGTIGGAIAALFTLDFVNYFWHRARHRVPLLWRIFHQMHHSAERLDVPGAMYSHPMDQLAGAMLGSFAATVIGVTPDAAALTGYVMFVLSCLQHVNIKTPRALGYFIQRPESHSVHHARGVHAHNYAAFPIIDMLFGTFKNPSERAPLAGFWDGASAQLGSLLAARDVSRPPSAEHGQSAAPSIAQLAAEEPG